MNTIQQNEARYLVSGLDLSFRNMAHREPGEEVAQAAIDEALQALDPGKEQSSRAIDYALSQLYGRFVRLIGLQGLALDSETAQWWTQLKGFMANDIQAELRELGLPRGIL